MAQYEIEIASILPSPYRVFKRHIVTVTGEYLRESWVTGQLTDGSRGSLMGHKM